MTASQRRAALKQMQDMILDLAARPALSPSGLEMLAEMRATYARLQQEVA